MGILIFSVTTKILPQAPPELPLCGPAGPECGPTQLCESAWQAPDWQPSGSCPELLYGSLAQAQHRMILPCMCACLHSKNPDCMRQLQPSVCCCPSERALIQPTDSRAQRRLLTTRLVHVHQTVCAQCRRHTDTQGDVVVSACDKFRSRCRPDNVKLSTVRQDVKGTRSYLVLRLYHT